MTILFDILRKNHNPISRKLEKGETVPVKKHISYKKPKMLWIGSLDSGIIPSLITGLDNEEILIHRNIANQVPEDDLSVHSIIEYSIGVLGVRSIVICGNTNCGGIKAALDNKGGESYASFRDWLQPLRQIARDHGHILDSNEDLEQKTKMLAFLNVRRQIEKVKKLPVVKANAPIEVLGWVFDDKTGLIMDHTQLDRREKNNGSLWHSLQPASSNGFQSQV